MKCEVCGAPESFKKVRLEGAFLFVCESCSKFEIKIRRKRKKKRVQKEIGEIRPDYPSTIVSARQALNLSRKKLAKRICEKESTIRRLESGKMLPDEDLVKKLEKFLGISLKEG